MTAMVHTAEVSYNSAVDSGHRLCAGDVLVGLTFDLLFHSTPSHSAAQSSSAQRSTASMHVLQVSTAPLATVQHSAAQHKASLMRACASTTRAGCHALILSSQIALLSYTYSSHQIDSQRPPH